VPRLRVHTGRDQRRSKDENKSGSGCSSHLGAFQRELYGGSI
jgi:hypothetical protein